MKLKDIYKNNKNPVISFEVFPPKGDNGDEKTNLLLNELSLLSDFNPAFISVTYGAGGTTQEKTFEIVKKIKQNLKLSPVPHFTCVGLSKDNILSNLKDIQDLEIKNILALRGDPPKGEEFFKKPKNGFGYANELVEFIQKKTNLNIAVAGYPECHPESSCLDKDIANLKKKVDAGASAIITQLFYENKSFFNYIEKLRAADINIPVIPGILPLSGYKQTEKIVSLSGCKIPPNFMDKLEKHKDDKQEIKKIGLEFAVNQCRELADFGVKGLHFYTLNKSNPSADILKALNF